MRPEKNLVINEIKARVDKTPYVLLTDYTGMQVPQFNELRNRLSAAKAEFRVVKNTLLRRALQGSNLPDLETYLHGQSAVVLGDSDVSAAAKVLKNFTAEFKKPTLKVGILDKASSTSSRSRPWPTCRRRMSSRPSFSACSWRRLPRWSA